MRKVVLLLFILNLSVVYGQESFGIIHSNYATTNAVKINPANGVMSKSLLDVNLVGAKAFFNNNLVYLSKDNYQFSSLIQGNTDGLVPQYNLNRSKSLGYAKAEISGPAIALSVGDNAFELHANVVAYSNVRNIPNSIAQYAIDEQFPANGTYEHNNIKGGFLSYAEFGGSYSRNILKEGNDILSAGINLNYLVGIGGVGAKINNANYTVNGTDDVTLNSLNGEYMYVNPQWKSGKGISGGLGINYAKMETSTRNYEHNTISSDCDCEDYKFKIGASLIDLGYVNFKNNAQYRNFTENSSSEADSELQNASPEELDGVIAGRTSSANQTVWSTSKIYLPGAASIQADYKMANHFYVAGAYIHGFNKGKYRFGVQRPKSLSVTPRVEFKRFEFAMPVSLYEWQKPQVGAMLRLNNNIIIGTDKLGAFTGKTNVYGADFYVNLKFGIIDNPRCKEKSHNQRNKGVARPKPTSNKSNKNTFTTKSGKGKNSSSSKGKKNGKGNKFKSGKKSRGKVNSYECPAFQ